MFRLPFPVQFSARAAWAFAVLLLLLVPLSCTSSPEAVLDIRTKANGPRYGDNDPHDWTGRAPWDYPVHGIDVSKFQREIDWHAVRRAGIQFAFIKATEGGDMVDDRFRDNWQAARRAGVKRGAYHFYYFCRPAIEQARWFVRHVPREKGALPPVLDMEWNHKSPTCKLRPSAAIVRREMGVFLDFMRRHYKQKPIVYTTVDFYRDNELSRLDGPEFWLRSVADHPDITYPGQEWTFWQYTGTGQMPGVEGDTDINVFRGSKQAWDKWLEEATR